MRKHQADAAEAGVVRAENEASHVRGAKNWTPTKYVLVDRRWGASRDPRELAIASRLVGDLMVRFYQKAIEQYASGKLVDLGCGKAPLYGIYRDKVESVVRVDWGESRHGSAFVDCKADLNGRLPFADDVFDTVLATDVLEHIREPKSFWSEIARTCKAGGYIILGTPFFYWIHEDPYDYARYTRYSLVSECDRNGLKVSSLEECGGFPEVLCDLLLKSMLEHARLCSMMDRLFRVLLKLSSTRRYSRKSRKRFPLGYCMVARKV
jgi:SAM-dependent methyltransferase